jgi:hypothetical protein
VALRSVGVMGYTSSIDKKVVGCLCAFSLLKGMQDYLIQNILVTADWLSGLKQRFTGRAKRQGLAN